MREAGLEESEIAEIQQGLSIPEMDRSILNPNYRPPVKKPVSPSEQPDVIPKSEPHPDQLNAWTAAWDEPSHTSPAIVPENPPPGDPE
jgi:hypothetical protein